MACLVVNVKCGIIAESTIASVIRNSMVLWPYDRTVAPFNRREPRSVKVNSVPGARIWRNLLNYIFISLRWTFVSLCGAFISLRLAFLSSRGAFKSLLPGRDGRRRQKGGQRCDSFWRLTHCKRFAADKSAVPEETVGPLLEQDS
jgi:hypothetical protein